MRKIVFILIPIVLLLAKTVNGQNIVTIQGRLIDKSNNPVQATITIGSLSNTTDSNGNYFLQVSQGTYDIRYNVQNFEIALSSYELNENKKDLVNYITTYDNKVSFILDSDEEMVVQIQNNKNPSRVLINGTEMTNVSSINNLTNSTWFYNSTDRGLYMKTAVKTSLIGYWKFDDGSGSTVHDSSSYHHDGTLYNSPVWVAGKSGYALQFNGVNQYVTVNNVPFNILQGAQNTVAFWMYWGGTDSQMPIMFPQNFYDIAFYNGCFGLNTGNGEVLGISSSGLANKWIHVAAIFYNGLTSSTAVSLYINGVKQNIFQCTGNSPYSRSVNSTIEIGGGWYSNYYLGGSIDEVKVWNRALTANEIMAEYVGSVHTCALDGTPYGSCSANKPKYCDNNGNLLNNYCYGPDKIVGTADDCGCSSGVCQSDGSCAVTTCDSNCKLQNYGSGNCRTSPTPNSGFNGIGMYGESGLFAGKDANWIATNYDEAQLWPGDGPNIAQIHAIKPTFVALLYRDMMAAYSWWNGTDEVAFARQNNWILKDSSGNELTCPDYPGYYYVDFGNPSLQQYVAQRVEDYIQKYGFDGVMLDNGLPADRWGVAYARQSGVGEAINPRTGQPWTDPEVIDAEVSFHNTLRAAIGNNKVILPNGIWTGQSFFGPDHSNYLQIFQRSQMNGHGGEGFFNVAGNSGTADQWDNPVTWKQDVDTLAWSQTNYPNYYIGPGSRFPDFNYTIYSVLLAISGPHVAMGDFARWTAAEATAVKSDLAFAKTLGQPLGAYTYNSATGVYSRQFEHGTINVKPSNHSYWLSSATTSGTCQSGETSINQDGCPSGVCCCSGAAQQCTPANDIIKQTSYPSGSCLSSTSYAWSHSNCGSASVCNQGSCKLANASLTSYALPSGKYARSDSISIPYTIKNTGNTPWCFITEAGTTKSDSSNTWPNKFNSVAVGSSTSDSLSYQVSCSDPLGVWSGSLYTFTDYSANGGWMLWGAPTFSFNVVECLNDQDCVNCKDSGYTCDSTTNTCRPRTSGQNVLSNGNFDYGWTGYSGLLHADGYPYDFNDPTHGWASIDYSVLFNGHPTLRVTSNPSETDFAAADAIKGQHGDCTAVYINSIYGITPGEDVWIQGYVKTNDYAGSCCGGWLAGDWHIKDPPYFNDFTALGTIVNVTSLAPNGYTPWGTSTWSFVRWHIKAPSDVDFLVPWMMVLPMGSGTNGVAWFADLGVYVGPETPPMP